MIVTWFKFLNSNPRIEAHMHRILENRMEKNIRNDMETGVVQGCSCI